ncbi:MAG: sugar transferase [Planctomycetes bacterium]|nr:sugar transferase [Planctomycetota bacterium]
MDSTAVSTAGSPAAPEAPLRALWRHKGTLLLAADVLTVSSAFMFSFYLRFQTGWLSLPPVEHTEQYLKGAVLLTAIWVLLLWRRDGYASGFRGVGARLAWVRALVESAGGAIGALMVISFLYRDLLLSRQVYLTTTGFALGGMVLTRLLVRAVERDLAPALAGTRRILLLGEGRQAHEFAEHLRGELPCYELVGLAAPPAGAGECPPPAGTPAATPIQRIRAAHAAAPFDKIVLSLGELERALGPEAALVRILELVNECEAKGITLYALPDSFNVAVKASEVASLSGIPLLRLQDAARHPGYAVLKRVLDVTIALGVLLVGMPLWAALALAVKLTSPGPVFHTQRRIGLHGRPFRMFKFRSMRAGAEAEFDRLVDLGTLAVPGVKLAADRRVTAVGKWLRKTSLDEVPQLLNVLRGEMALVGPRPELPCLVERYSVFERRRLKGLPGITGFQQVMARNQPLAGALRYDLAYLKEQGLLFDAYILARTIPVLLRGR